MNTRRSVGLHQFRQARLIEGNFTTLQGDYLVSVSIHSCDMVPKIREARPRSQDRRNLFQRLLFSLLFYFAPETGYVPTLAHTLTEQIH